MCVKLKLGERPFGQTKPVFNRIREYISLNGHIAELSLANRSEVKESPQGKIEIMNSKKLNFPQEANETLQSSLHYYFYVL